MGSLGLSQEQLARMWEEQNAGRTLGGRTASSTAPGLYDGVRHVPTSYIPTTDRFPYGGALDGAPVRRIVDRVSGEATLYGSTRGGYSSVQPQINAVPVPQFPEYYAQEYYAQPQYYAQPVQAAPTYVVETAPTMVTRAPVVDYRPSFSALGYVPCDVMPGKAATVHDVWSGANFCEEVAEILQASGNRKYFSEGVKEPKMHQVTLQGRRERDMTDKAGIGIALERSEATGLVTVKRLAMDGSAAADGRLRQGDLILAVDGFHTSVIGSELTNLIIGPEGTFVELVVEHINGEQEAIQIRRGVPTSSAHFPPTSVKSYQEVPYYLSASDRQQATLEVSNCIAEMRRRILQPQAVHGDGIRNAIHGTYGVAKRNTSDPPQPVPAPATSPKVIHTVPSPGAERAMKSPTNGAEWNGNDDDKIDFLAQQARFAQQEAESLAAQARFAQQEAELNMKMSASAPSTYDAPLDWTSDRAAQQAAEYDKAEAQALAAATANNSTLDEKKKKKKRHTDV